ncbi:aspartyl-tRNA(Asn)/glutamyl-tRNA(Gln) amidotransferase subunit A [Acrasis kona]|uniref:Glutamyl-tRNA(Gln) amidotransferase subunit A, mitochondrial n=1 Tax=Acrasis kona TaxID=1008807 RepID=A0AAW2ZCX0_9EUKA
MLRTRFVRLFKPAFRTASRSKLHTSEVPISADKCHQLAVENKNNAFVHVVDHNHVAKKIQESAQRQSPLSPIDGVPFAIKDNFCTKDIPTTAASSMLKDFVPSYDATIYEKLENAGAILIGKTNLDEFAMGSSTTFSLFGATKNPITSEETIAGGSSGGSAASVAEGSSAFSIGSDTGGSVRQPASYCGIVGFKPSYGACSRHGVISFASSLDTVGILSPSVHQAGLVYNVIRGQDSKDSTSHNNSTPYTQQQNHKKFKIAVPVEYFVDELEEEVVKVWQSAIDHFKSLGAEVQYVSLPHTKFALSAYYIIASAEASSNLGRYDGIRYGGVHDAESKTLHQKYISNRSKGFGDEVKRRIMTGTFALSVGEYKTYFEKAQKMRSLIARDFQNVFDDGFDLVLTLTTPTCAIPSKTFNDLSPVDVYVNDLFTVPASLAGLPAISVPWRTENSQLKFAHRHPTDIFK